MNNFKIAVAQVPSVKGDIACNIATHLQAIAVAGAEGVSVLIFPELSLTGYEPELAAALAFTCDDSRLAPLIEAARAHNLYIIVGAPLAGDPLPRIGALIVSPTGEVSSYAKMYLHEGEECYFSPGDAHHLLDIGGHTMALAVCADTSQAAHASACAAQGADIYLTSMLISANGYEHDTVQLASYARDHKMLVAMANHNRPTGGLAAIGKSAMWTAAGRLACADEAQSALVTAQTTAAGWIAEVVTV
ncbi:carbon-nitrogen hydrolase family protein [Phytohalomonas tamaricis]|uniref:carbon-nitrogen hydrolase family protein n=1 Tax=Phytohalomonas tamaricis TaxID=2081032 RepID=UPI001319FF95|nr:carbon-nitrogen hydrolase family protein [Phytohalomonas tamaricis]